MFHFHTLLFLLHGYLYNRLLNTKYTRLTIKSYKLPFPNQYAHIDCSFELPILKHLRYPYILMRYSRQTLFHTLFPKYHSIISKIISHSTTIHFYPYLSISRVKSFRSLFITPILSIILKSIDEQLSMFVQNTLRFFCDMLLVDKQRPKTLEEMDYHKDMSINLMKLVFCFYEALCCRHHPMSFHICCFMVLRAVGRKPASWRSCVKCLDRV